jgi:hypothetical protein
VSDQPPSWDQFRQQTPPDGQPQYPPPRPDGQQPSFTPDPQYAPPSGGPSYQGQPYQGQPYQGQPYQGQPYQGQPPYEPPPGGQPPYPGPAYGYGPQPPRRKRHLVRNTLTGIGGLVVVIIVISAVASHGSGVTTAPSGNSAAATDTASPAATHKAAPARVGSYFDVQDDSGDTYRVTLVKVIDPAQGADEFSTPDNGKRFVGIAFKIKALKGSPQDEDANNDAAIVGSNGQVYSADFDDIAGYTNFDNGTIHVAQGDTQTGSVTFQVPDKVKVAEVQWTASGGFGATVQWDVRS